MIPSLVGETSHSGIGSQLSYPSQWPVNVGHHTMPSNQINLPGDMLQHQNNGFLFNPLNSSNIRQQLQIPIVCGHPPNQSSPSPNVAGFFPPGYSFVYPAIVAALAAHSNAINSRAVPRFCVPQGSAQTSPIRGHFQLTHPASHGIPIGNVAVNQQAGMHPPFQYIHTTGGLQLASFPAAVNNPIHNSAICSFPHAPVMGQGPQQLGSVAAVQFRSYDSLKHFGALPLLQSNKRNKSMTTSKTNLYISGLSEFDTDETVRALVKDVIHPKSCKAMLLNGKCKGSGFIDCATEEDALAALNHLSEVAKNGGRKLNVKYALENEKDLLNVYVRNLPRTGFTKETLENLFRPYGQVTSVKLLETDGAYTGIGFVRFASAEQAQAAVDSMNEARYVLVDSPGAGKPICCKLADKADPKRRASSLASSQSTFSRPFKSDISFTETQHLQHSIPGVLFQPGVLGDGSIMPMPQICPPTTVTYNGISASISSSFHHSTDQHDLLESTSSEQYHVPISFSSFPSVETTSPFPREEFLSIPSTVNSFDFDVQVSSPIQIEEHLLASNASNNSPCLSLPKTNFPSANDTKGKFSGDHNELFSKVSSVQNSDKILNAVSVLGSTNTCQDPASLVPEFQNLTILHSNITPHTSYENSSHFQSATKFDPAGQSSIHSDLSVDSHVAPKSCVNSIIPPLVGNIDKGIRGGESVISSLEAVCETTVSLDDKIVGSSLPSSSILISVTSEEQSASTICKEKRSHRSNCTSRQISASQNRPHLSTHISKVESKVMPHRSTTKPTVLKDRLPAELRPGRVSQLSSNPSSEKSNCSGAFVSSSL